MIQGVPSGTEGGRREGRIGTAMTGRGLIGEICGAQWLGQNRRAQAGTIMVDKVVDDSGRV
jgi:hypothetical protein